MKMKGKKAKACVPKKSEAWVNFRQFLLEDAGIVEQEYLKLIPRCKRKT